MTCIVGLKHGGKVYLGADSAGVDSNYGIDSRRDPKIYRNGDFLIGFTSSFRMGQLLGYKLTIPPRNEGQEVMHYMVTSVIESIRDCLKTGGYSRIDNNQEAGGTFLLAYKGQLFTIFNDFQVSESLNDYAACGCGADIALGSLYSTKALDPDRRLQLALAAAEKFSAGVRGPFQYEDI